MQFLEAALLDLLKNLAGKVEDLAEDVALLKAGSDERERTQKLLEAARAELR